MKTLRRNRQTLYYALYTGKTAVLDSSGSETGEYIVTYGTPISIRASVSPASGYAQFEQFGTDLSYDKVVITDDMSCPIDENTVLYVDKVPETVNPTYDYVVKRVAKSLNCIAYAISKVARP